MNAVLTLVCVTLVGVAFWALSRPAHVVYRQQVCYAEIDRPLVVYCPNGRTYWHDIGPVTPLPATPRG